MSTPPHLEAFLPPHIHMAWCGADIVILNMQADEYALLVDLADKLQQTAAPGVILIDPAILDDLLQNGLAVTHRSVPSRQNLVETRDEIASSPCRNPITLGLTALNALDSTARFHRLSLGDLVETASRRRASKRTRPLQEALGAFQSIYPWIPFEGDCLQRAFMLHHHLHTQGHKPSWIFGVRTWPFLAHCWLQIDDQVIGDTVERVQGFTPIMVV